MSQSNHRKNMCSQARRLGQDDKFKVAGATKWVQGQSGQPSGILSQKVNWGLETGLSDRPLTQHAQGRGSCFSIKTITCVLIYLKGKVELLTWPHGFLKSTLESQNKKKVYWTDAKYKTASKIIPHWFQPLVEGWRDGSAVRNTSYSSGRPKFNT